MNKNYKSLIKLLNQNLISNKTYEEVKNEIIRNYEINKIIKFYK